MNSTTDNTEPTEPTAETEPIAPVAIATEASPKTRHTELPIPAGYVLLVALHADGTERAGTEFLYPQKDYPRYYGDQSRFRVKKKAN